MKKTPIMELIDYYNQNSSLDPYVLSLILRGQMESMLQKEKAFAFDCWMEATNLAYWNHSMFAESSDKPKFTSFDEFYSQYAEKHT